MAVSCIHNASGHNYGNRSVIVDLAMGQIPRSTERITNYTGARFSKNLRKNPKICVRFS